MDFFVERIMSLDEFKKDSDRIRKQHKLYALRSIFGISRIIINDPYVILFDKDGLKYQVKAQDGDIFKATNGVFLMLLKYIVSPDRYTEIIDYLDKNLGDGKFEESFLLGMLIPIFGVDVILDIWSQAMYYEEVKDSTSTYTINIQTVIDSHI